MRYFYCQSTPFDEVEDKLFLEYECLGERDVKNTDKPVRLHRILMGLVTWRISRSKSIRLVLRWISESRSETKDDIVVKAEARRMCAEDIHISLE